MQKTILLLKLMRLHRPVGIFLLLWPTLWALWLANHGMPPMNLLLIFVLGTIITRSAGCIINDIFDRDFDRHVARTQDRPLTAHQLTLPTALILLFFLALGALLLALQLNRFAFLLSLLAAGLAAIYPLMKRITHFPQVILGLAYSMGIPIAYAASQNSLPAPCLLLFLINVLWTLMYDTAYAITDQADDLKIGLKSTATFFKHHSILFIAILQTLVSLGWLWIGHIEQLSLVYFWMWALCVGFFFYQQFLLKQGKTLAAFLNNQWVGFFLWLGIILGR